MHINKTNNFIYAIPAIIVFIVLFFIRGVPFEDDTYIIYRYAENWASGNGLVFNIGEHVEGVSTFLWTAMVALGAYLSFDPVQLTPIMNLFVGIMCLFFMFQITSFIQFSTPRLMTAVLTLFCALTYGFYYYAASGMDTIIFSLVLLICITSLYKSYHSEKYLMTVFSLILLDLVRAEGFVYTVILLGILCLFVIKDRKTVPRKLMGTVLVVAGATALMFAVRYYYYNEWMPATVMAKGYATYLIKTALLTGDFEVMKEFFYVMKSGLKYEAFLVLMGVWIPFIVLVGKKNRDNILLWLIATSIFINIFITLWAGGDYFPYKRHFIAVLPVTIIFVAWAMDVLFHRYWGKQLYRKAILTTVLTLFLVLWSVYFMKPAVFTKTYHESGRSLNIRQIGSLLHEVPESTTMLSQMIGKISYYAGNNVYVRDILGLTDIHNAKYGDEWGFNLGKGACGRTDFDYSFKSPFDIFFYNSSNMHKKFISFCLKNPSICNKYRFLKTNEWIDSETYIIVNINHPVSSILQKNFGATARIIDNNLKNIISH